MAIVVEEEKSRVNIIRLLAWVAIIGVLGAGIYYIFFTAPELVVISPPAGFQTIAPLGQISLQPEGVLNSAAYTALKPPQFPLPVPQGPVPVGRTNPFVSP